MNQLPAFGPQRTEAGRVVCCLRLLCRWLSVGSAGLWSPTTRCCGKNAGMEDIKESRDANPDVGSEAQRLEPGPARCPSTVVASRLYG